MPQESSNSLKTPPSVPRPVSGEYAKTVEMTAIDVSDAAKGAEKKETTTETSSISERDIRVREYRAKKEQRQGIQAASITKDRARVDQIYAQLGEISGEDVDTAFDNIIAPAEPPKSSETESLNVEPESGATENDEFASLVTHATEVSAGVREVGSKKLFELKDAGKGIALDYVRKAMSKGASPLALKLEFKKLREGLGEELFSQAKPYIEMARQNFGALKQFQKKVKQVLGASGRKAMEIDALNEAIKEKMIDDPTRSPQEALLAVQTEDETLAPVVGDFGKNARRVA